jgi:hypothetical protein
MKYEEDQISFIREILSDVNDLFPKDASPDDQKIDKGIVIFRWKKDSAKTTRIEKNLKITFTEPFLIEYQINPTTRKAARDKIKKYISTEFDKFNANVKKLDEKITITTSL